MGIHSVAAANAMSATTHACNPATRPSSPAPLLRSPTATVVFHRKPTGQEYPQWDSAGLPMLLPLGKTFANGGKTAEKAMMERLVEALRPLRRQGEGGQAPSIRDVRTGWGGCCSGLWEDGVRPAAWRHIAGCASLQRMAGSLRGKWQDAAAGESPVLTPAVLLVPAGGPAAAGYQPAPAALLHLVSTGATFGAAFRCCCLFDKCVLGCSPWMLAVAAICVASCPLPRRYPPGASLLIRCHSTPASLHCPPRSNVSYSYMADGDAEFGTHRAYTSALRYGETFFRWAGCMGWRRLKLKLRCAWQS